MWDDIAHSCSFLDLATAKTEARFNINSLPKENIKSFLKY